MCNFIEATMSRVSSNLIILRYGLQLEQYAPLKLYAVMQENAVDVDDYNGKYRFLIELPVNDGEKIQSRYYDENEIFI